MSDHRERLERLRDQLAAALDSASENMLPQLAGQYMRVLAEIAGLPAEPVAAPKGVMTIDEAKQRRADRKSGTAPPAVAASGGGKRGR